MNETENVLFNDYMPNNVMFILSEIQIEKPTERKFAVQIPDKIAYRRDFVISKGPGLNLTSLGSTTRGRAPGTVVLLFGAASSGSRSVAFVLLIPAD